MLLNALVAGIIIAGPTLAAPSGGQGLNGSTEYVPLSDFDFQSLLRFFYHCVNRLQLLKYIWQNLALQQEWLELYLFRKGIEQFSQENFTSAGFSQADQELLSFMADQEVGHAQLLTNIL
ncbi:hypothetical protein QCA50_011529 [Cerrena zonata]|uniref:Uncharacterized protein n=1 Tax=Cerrena zonata TaxID=2478898 RepID=A0AAW0FW82_9APHY